MRVPTSAQARQRVSFFFSLTTAVLVDAAWCLACSFYALVFSVVEQWIRKAATYQGWGSEWPRAGTRTFASASSSSSSGRLWDLYDQRPQRGRATGSGTCSVSLGEELTDPKPPCPLLIPWCPCRLGLGNWKGPQRRFNGQTCRNQIPTCRYFLE